MLYIGSRILFWAMEECHLTRRNLPCGREIGSCRGGYLLKWCSILVHSTEQVQTVYSSPGWTTVLSGLSFGRAGRFGVWSEREIHIVFLSSPRNKRNCTDALGMNIFRGMKGVSLLWRSLTQSTRSSWEADCLPTMRTG